MPSAMSEGKLPSAAWSSARRPTRGPWPSARWRGPASPRRSSGGPARSPVERGGSSVRSAATSDSRAHDCGRARPARRGRRRRAVGVCRRRRSTSGASAVAQPLGVRADRLAGLRRERCDSGVGGRSRAVPGSSADASGQRISTSASVPGLARTAERVDGAARRRRADAVEQLQQPEPRQLVARVVGQAEQARAGP